MGYWTYFDLRLEGTDEACEKVKRDILAKDEDLEELVKYGGSNMKWYNWEEVMYDVALNNPDVLIILDGDGEEADDTWQWRAKGEQTEMQYSKIPPFENKELWLNVEKRNNN